MPEIFESHIHNWILFPVLVIKVPPLFGDNLEPLPRGVQLDME